MLFIFKLKIIWLYNEMEEFLKELEDEGCEVVVGWREKERKKI